MKSLDSRYFAILGPFVYSVSHAYFFFNMAEEQEIPELPMIEMEYEQQVENVSIISQPLASKKLTKKVLKLVKKASKQKQLKRGVKEVSKSLRKGLKGMVVIAGDVYPIDIIAHLPILCEENSVEYCYVPSKDYLGQAGMTTRPTSVLMLVDSKEDKEYTEIYDEVSQAISELK